MSFIFLPSRLCRGFGPRRNGEQKCLFIFAFDRLEGVSFRRAAMSALRGLGAGAAWRGRSQCGLVASLHVCPRAARLPSPTFPPGVPGGTPCLHACPPPSRPSLSPASARPSAAFHASPHWTTGRQYGRRNGGRNGRRNGGRNHLSVRTKSQTK